MVSASERIGAFFKTSWMSFWRLMLLGIVLNSDGLLVLSILSPFFIGLTFALTGYSVAFWPLFTLLRGRNPLTRAGSEPRRFGSRSLRVPPPPRVAPGPALQKATRPGRITGYEPRALQPIKLQRSPWIIGDPGFGLSASGFDATSVQLGQAGERNFARALQKAGLIDRFQSFWSVAMPAAHALVKDSLLETDIDCILYDGRQVWLVDLKNYKGGDVVYSSSPTHGLSCVDRATGQAVEVTRKQSRNMSMAQERFARLLSPARIPVRAAVVFMPTESGAGELRGVRWPGMIEAMYVDQFLAGLQSTQGYQRTEHSDWAAGALSRLVKR